MRRRVDALTPRRVDTSTLITKANLSEHLTGTVNVSFAGLKAAVKRRVEAEAPLVDATRADLAAAFQEAAISHVVDRLQRGLHWCQPTNGAAWAAPPHAHISRAPA